MPRTFEVSDEVNLMDHRKKKGNDRGQILVLLAIIIPMLIIFLGLALDYGLAYVAKTTLSKAVDAAALAAMRNLNQGETQAGKDAIAAFQANYQTVPGLGSAPTPTVNWFTTSPCISGNTCVSISATTTINTNFLRLLSLVPGIGSSFNSTTITISATAQRNPLVMSLVLDRSGSMNYNGGATALPPAVTDFISYFDQGVDNIAEISFSSVDSVDVPMTTSFQTPIDNEMENIVFGGGTFAQAGLQDGFNQILSKPLTPNIIRVVVFFTDGWANTDGLPTNVTTATASTTHDSLNCTGTASRPVYTILNYGGCAPLENEAGWCGNYGNTEMFYMNPTTGNTVTCQNSLGQQPTTFPVQAPGVSNSLTQANVTLDATYRTEQLASVMRNSTNQITVYSIGLGDKINEAYLQDIANDPAAPTYDSSQPQGEAVFAPTSSQLDALFETIASKILLRLSS